MIRRRQLINTYDVSSSPPHQKLAARSRVDSSSRRPAGTREGELLQRVVLHTHRVCLCSNTVTGCAQKYVKILTTVTDASSFLSATTVHPV